MQVKVKQPEPKKHSKRHLEVKKKSCPFGLVLGSIIFTAFGLFCTIADDHNLVHRLSRRAPTARVRIEQCGCEREQVVKEDVDKEGIEFSDTACGREAYLRGAGQRVGLIEQI